MQISSHQQQIQHTCPLSIIHVLANQRLPRHPDANSVAGPARVALEVARQQVRFGHRVRVVVASTQAWQAVWHGVLLIGIRMAAPYACVRVGNRTLDLRQHLPYMLLTLREPCDIVHGHGYYYMRGIRARARVVHIHGDPTHPGSSSHESLHLNPSDYATITRYSHAQVAVSHCVADAMQRGFAQSQIHHHTSSLHVVYNGVDNEQFDATRWHTAAQQLRWARGIAPDECVLLYAGAIVPEKGALHLAHAFAALAMHNPHIHLMIAGSSDMWNTFTVAHKSVHHEYARDVEQALQAAHITRQVHLLGAVPSRDMPAVYAACDAVVVPSVCRESFSLTAVEALASSRPVICSNSGGITEVVDATTGILVPAGDEAALADALHRVIDHPAWRQQLGAAGRTKARTFSWHTSAHQLDALYHTILGFPKQSHTSQW